MKKKNISASSEDMNSEEVRDIIERMPTHWAMWVALVTSAIVVVIFALSCFVKYPEFVSGDITITMKNAPVRLLSNASGQIHLLAKNRTKVKSGEVVAYIENGTSYDSYGRLSCLLNMALNGKVFRLLQNNKALGELGSYYNAFVRAKKQLDQLRESPLYENLCQNLNRQIQVGHAIVVFQDREIALKGQQLELSRQLLSEDSLLVMSNSLSKERYQERKNACIAYEDNFISLQGSRAASVSEIGKNQIELSRVRIQRQEDLKQVLADYDRTLHELADAVYVWEKRYLIKSPVAGVVEYLGFWRENVTVESSRELFSVIPSENAYVGEAYIPVQGAGKVRVGQKVNVTLEDFPAWEYGKIEGRVVSVSQTSANVNVGDNMLHPMYLVAIDFPKGMSTNYGTILKTKPEIKGQVSIVTTPKRLNQRLFDNLRMIGE